MKLIQIASEKVHVSFKVSISKETGEVKIKMKEGLCKFKVGNKSLSEILNLIVMGKMGVDLASVSQKLNEYGVSNEVGRVEAPAHPLTAPVGEALEPQEEETTSRQRAKLGNV